MEEYKKMVDGNSYTQDDLDKYKQNNPFPQIITFLKCKNVYFSFIVNDGRLYYTLHYPETNKTIQAIGKRRIPIIDDIFNCLKIMPQTSFKDNLYYAVEATKLSHIERFKNANEDDNPIIVSLAIKQ